MNGTVATGFEAVREAFAHNFEALGERGAGVVVHRDGHKVVDLWAGTRDVSGGAPGSAAPPRSCAPPRRAWPPPRCSSCTSEESSTWTRRSAFTGPSSSSTARRTSASVTSSRTAPAVPALDRPLTPAEAADPDTGAAAVAAQAPAWEPGTDHGYHAQTYSWLTGELVRRVTGRTVGAWIAEHIAAPVGADLWVGLPDAEAHRAGLVGPVEPPAAPGGLRTRPKRNVADAYTDPDSLTRRAFGAIHPAPDENDPAYRAAELPASNGVATAEGLSRFYASLIGEVDGGVRLFTPDTMEEARTEASSGADRVLVVPTRFGLGYMLHGVASPLLGPGSFGHPGRGGALGFADPESGIAFGYVTNGRREGVTADPRAQALVRAVRSSLAG